MAVQSSFYVPDGNTRTFPSTKHIATKQHVGVYLQRALDSVWVTALSTSYELVNNSIVFDSAVDNVLYIQIEIRVVDTTAELIDSPSNIALVAASIADVNTVADSILDVNIVADNISSVQNTSAISANITTVAGISTNVTTVAGVSTSIPTVAGISANVTTVAGVSGNVTTVASDIANVNTAATSIVDINSVATTIVPNIAEILLADDNATTATAQAGIATTQATNASSSATQAQLYEWEAEAERLTADSYATEAEDVFVKLVTSDGDGTFTYTPTTDYSALHYSLKAATFNPAIYAPIASPTFTGTVVLPSTTSIGTITNTELSYIDGVTSSVQTQINGKAPLASPALTGTPTAPTAAAGTNTTQLATTAFVKNKSELDSIGVGQTWQNVTASRVLGTTYTNSTGKPISVSARTIAATTAHDIYIVVAGVVVASIRDDGTSISKSAYITAIIPNETTYSVVSNKALSIWTELR